MMALVGGRGAGETASRWLQAGALCCGVLCFGALSSLLLGAWHLAVTVPAGSVGACEMTYMHPNYYAVPNATNSSRLSSKYRLLQYSHTELLPAERRHKASDVVLFVPGSMGSSGQVRSVGKETIALLQAQGRGKTEVAVYAADFDEEPSGLCGTFLRQQVEFVEDALALVAQQHLQQLQRSNSSRPLNVVLLAHSMGGLVARVVVAGMDAGTSKVAWLAPHVTAVVTLSSPHQAPVVGADASMQWLYADLLAHADATRTYLSLAGGYRDTLVRSELARLDRAQYPRSASVLTQSAYGISADHLSILWCNEVAKDLARRLVAAFDSGDASALTAGLTDKRIPAMGFTRKERDWLGPGPDGFVAAHVMVDVVARKAALAVLPYAFAVALLLLSRLAGASGATVALFATAGVLLSASRGGAAGLDVDVWQRPVAWAATPVVLLASAAALQAAVSLLLGLSGRWWLRGALALLRLQECSVVALVAGLFMCNGGGVEMLGAVLLFLAFNAALLVLTLLASQGPLQHMLGLLYLPALPAWVGACLFALSLFKPTLTVDDHLPGALVQQPRGPLHAMLDEDLPELVAAGASLPRQSSAGEAVFLLASALTLLPVLLHLTLELHHPRMDAEEKVLDSHYEKVELNENESEDGRDAGEHAGQEQGQEGRRPRAPWEGLGLDGRDPSDASEGSPAQARSQARAQAQAQGGVVSAVETAQGVVLFNDTKYASRPHVATFANGESVQVDDIALLAGAGEGGPVASDAVPLMAESPRGPSRGGRRGRMLVQRIRSAQRAFPESVTLRVALATLAVAAMLLDPAHLFVLQGLAPAAAFVCLILRKESQPVERVVHRTG